LWLGFSYYNSANLAKTFLSSKKHHPFPAFGNGCAKWERLRERLRKMSDIFLLKVLSESINFAAENNKNL
jgi:hypothetical protein